MKFTEEYCDLFSVPDKYYLAHCISADFALGKGIAVEFNKKFNAKNLLFKSYNNFLELWDSSNMIANCIITGRVINLVTKRNYWNKPTYESITKALKLMKLKCLENNIEYVAMPLIGCGLDRLKWSNVSDIIKNVFKDTDIEILICMKF